MIAKLKVVLIGLVLVSCLVACGQTTTTTTTEDAPQADVPVEEAPTGWQNMIGDGVVLSLPARYEGGNPSQDLDDISEQLQAIDPAFTQRVEAIKQNAGAIALLAFDPQSTQSGTITNVNIIKEELPEGTTVQQSLDAAAGKLALVYEIIDQKVVSLPNYEAARIVAQADSGETQIKPLFYLIPDGETFWLVTYTTTAAEFNQRLPNFERSIKTFAIEPQQ